MSATSCCPPVHTVGRVSYFVLSTSAHSGTWSATSCIPLVHTVEHGQLLRAVHQCTQWNVSATSCCPPVHTVERVISKACRQERKRTSVQAYKHTSRAQCTNLCYFQTFSMLWSFLTNFPSINRYRGTR